MFKKNPTNPLTLKLYTSCLPRNASVEVFQFYTAWSYLKICLQKDKFHEMQIHGLC